ncbi:hypothetical protein HDU86_005705 [Geranomyces michiganensis]|nr:hypothetical protein HDU86_005705 [Geranomyces michiganensis]
MPRQQTSRLPMRVTRSKTVGTKSELSVEETVEEVSTTAENSPVKAQQLSNTEDATIESEEEKGEEEKGEEEEEEEEEEEAAEPATAPTNYDSDEIIYSSDDEEGGASGAEEAVSAAAAKELALATAQVAREKEIKEKTLARQKRREKAEWLKAQQSTKKEKLASRLTRLPDELLQAAAELEKAEEEEGEESVKAVGGKHTRLPDDPEDELRPKKKGKKQKGEYVIGGFRVVNRTAMKKPPAADPATLRFRRDQLFRPQVPRTDAVKSMTAAGRIQGPAPFFIRQS